MCSDGLWYLRQSHDDVRRIERGDLDRRGLLDIVFNVIVYFRHVLDRDWFWEHDHRSEQLHRRAGLDIELEYVRRYHRRPAVL